MILLRTLAIWVGCGVASMLTWRSSADQGASGLAPSPPEQAPRRADRIVTLQFIEPQIEATPLTLKGPEV